MIQLVKVEDHLCAANMVAQHGYVSRANPVAIRYDALAQCLSKLAGQIEEGTLITATHRLRARRRELSCANESEPSPACLSHLRVLAI